MVVVALTKTDLPRNQRKHVTDAVKILYERVVNSSDGKDASKKRNEGGRLGDFAATLKKSLDAQLKPHWHVLAGKRIGFACKKRNTTMAVFRIGTGKAGEKLGEMMVVIWKSPGIEAPEDDPLPPPPDGSGAEAAETTSGTAARDFHVVQPSKVEEGTEEGTTVATLRDAWRQHSACTDVQELAQVMRRKLTSDLGTIWHVAAGADFVASPAENCRNHVIVSVGKTPIRIVCWQHEQIMGERMDWKKITSALPYLMVVLLCFAYMLFQSICPGDKSWLNAEPTSLRLSAAKWLHGKICSNEEWEYNFGMYAVSAVAVAFVGKRFVPKTA